MSLAVESFLLVAFTASTSFALPTPRNAAAPAFVSRTVSAVLPRFLAFVRAVPTARFPSFSVALNFVFLATAVSVLFSPELSTDAMLWPFAILNFFAANGLTEYLRVADEVRPESSVATAVNVCFPGLAE